MKRALVFLLAILILVPSAAKCADMVNCLGRAALGDNENKARQEAVADALRQAVALEAIKLLDPATLRTSLATLDEKIIAKADQFISSYTIETVTNIDKQVLALVSAGLDKAALEKALALSGLRVPVGHLGAFMLLVAEDAAPGRPLVYWWSGFGQPDGGPAVMAKVLKSMGVKITEPGPLRQNLPPELMQQSLTPDQALELARLAGSDIVVLGRVRDYPMVSEKDVAPPMLAELTAYEAGTGRALAQVQTQGPLFNEPPGLEGAQQVQAALEEAVRNLVAQVAASRPIKAAENGQLEMEVSGVRSMVQLIKFEQVVGSLTSMVQSIERNKVGGGKAGYALKITVSPSRLADELLVQNFGDFLVNITEVEAGKMKLSLLPRH